MELRCAWRSTNISETSRLEYSIRYILRLMAASSTENAQCGVLPPVPIIYLSIGSIMLHCPRKLTRTFMYYGFSCGIVLTATPGLALAADPTGDWMVADQVANIRVAECNGSMWGAVVWEKTPGGRDLNNPDVALQSRPTLGMPILIDMKKKTGVDQWEGQVYNAKDGQSYSSTINPVEAAQLENQG